jgi:hypothetical protein
MSDDDAPRADLPSDDFAPGLRKMIFGLTAWFALATVALVSRDAVAVLIAGALAFAAVLVVSRFRLWRLRWPDPGVPRAPETATLERGWRERLRSAEPTMEVLLPIMAAALGMTLLALISYFDLGGAA